ncbi:MAG: ABC transporter substrate-binding protein [Gaiellaceae bacterium MAG52_C11]|nr:ABC transporter substrate-binding protein [Candidatus Gaiellasilicea maunaloa]
MTRAVQSVLAERSPKAGDRLIRVLTVDTAAPGAGQENEEHCDRIGRDLADDNRVVAVIGPLAPICTRTLIPSLNQADVAIVSPIDDTPGLTHVVPSAGGECAGCSPGAFYPTGVRNFARVIASVDSEASAVAELLRSRNATRVVIVEDGDPFATTWLANTFEAAADDGSIELVERVRYDLNAKSYASVGRRSVRANADAVYLLAPTYNRGAEVLQGLRSGGFQGTVVGSLSITDESILKAGGAARGAMFASTELPLAGLNASARAFVEAGSFGEYAVDAVYAAEAAHVLLDAISRSDGTRPGVRERLFQVSRNGLLGQLEIDANGDVVPQRIAFFEAKGAGFSYVETVTPPPP